MLSDRAKVTATLAAAAVTAVIIYRRRQRHRAVSELIEAHHASSAGEDGLYELSTRTLANAAGLALDSAEFATVLDTADPLRSFRREFHIPPHRGAEQAYMAGNSLGLQPRATAIEVKEELDKWAARGVMGHFEGSLPWATCEDALPPLLGELVGAKDVRLELGAMNSLTVNLHFLMAAFYRPTAGRAAILIEAGAFPSDRYATGSQIKHHGLDPAEWLIEVQPRADSLLHTVEITQRPHPEASRSDYWPFAPAPACPAPARLPLDHIAAGTSPRCVSLLTLTPSPPTLAARPHTLAASPTLAASLLVPGGHPCGH